MRHTPIPTAMMLLFALTTAGPALASEPGPSARLTFTIDGPSLEQSVPSVVELVATGDGTLSVTTGARLPIPNRSASGDDATNGDATRFSYQQVGLTLHARTHVTDDGRMRVAGTLEISGLAAGFVPGDLEAPPVVSASSCGFDVALADGQSERIVRLAGSDGDQLTVNLGLTLVD